MKDTKETKEFLAFLADIINAYDKAKSDDGKVSWPEAVGMITMNVPGLLNALRGAGEIPAEARDFTREEFNELRDFFLTRIGWTPDDNTRDLADAYFRLITDTYLNALRIINTKRPPRAELA
jgi:hypothetical protein